MRQASRVQEVVVLTHSVSFTYIGAGEVWADWMGVSLPIFEGRLHCKLFPIEKHTERVYQS